MSPVSDSPRGQLPRLHVLTDSRIVARRGFGDCARAAMEAGGSRLAFQLRVPGLTGRSLLDLARRCAADADDTGTWLLISDRVDVALSAGARGVHLPGSGLDPADARALWPGGCLGVSVHGVEEAGRTGCGEADYLTVGTLFSTPSHPGRPGGGSGLISEVGGVAGAMPLVGIGGVSVRRVGEVMEAGAHGVAVIRGVWGDGDPTPEEVAGRVRDLLETLPGT